MSLPEAVGALTAADATERLPSDLGAMIHLVDRGLEPMQAVRFAGDVGQTAQITVETQTLMAVKSADDPNAVPVPGIRAQLKVEVTAADAEMISLAVTIEKIALEARDEATERVLPEVRRVATPLLDGTHPLRVTARGLVIPPPPVADEAQAQLLASLWEAWADAFVVVPEVAFGPGAIWEVLSRRSRAGADLMRLDRVMVEADGDRLRYVVTTREVAVSGEGRDPALPDDLVTTTRSGVALGKRRLTRSPKGPPWPGSLTSQLATDIVFEVAKNGGGEARTKRTAVQLTQFGRMWRGPLDARGDAGQGSGDGR